MKLTSTQHYWLREAKDRYAMFHPGEELTEFPASLGYAYEHKSVVEAGLMEWMHGVPEPRAMSWLRLTPAGAEIVRAWIEEEK